jgi:hypothetical protein
MRATNAGPGVGRKPTSQQAAPAGRQHQRHRADVSDGLPQLARGGEAVARKMTSHAFTAGDQLGPYDIAAPLGEAGTGPSTTPPMS